MGSENGTPTSTRLAPASATAGRSSRVKARSGSPAVTNGMNALRPAARNFENNWSIGFMQRVLLGRGRPAPSLRPAGRGPRRQTLPHQLAELFEQVAGIMWAGGRLRVVLHAEHRQFRVPHSFERAVVQVDVRRLH